jgi:hypothetical protein
MYDATTLQAMPAVDYQGGRHDIQSGDLLFASGDFWLSKLIRKATGSMWSHVAIIYRIPPPTDRVLVLESVEVYGVRLAPLSLYLENYWRGRPYPGSVYIARCNQEVPVDHKQMFRVGFDLLTRQYGYLDLLRMEMRILFGKRFINRRDEYVCSELVDACFRRGGVAFEQNDQFISPEDIARDSKVQFVHRLL